MIRKLITAALASALAASAFAAPAAAQQRTGGASRSEPRAFVAMRNFSQCVVDRSPRAAAAVLAMDPAGAPYREALRRLAGGHDYCAPGTQLRFSGIFFVGGLAEALVTDRRGRSALASRVALDPARPAIQARDETELMTLCAVRAAPGEAASLFATEPASAAELAALRALAPTVSACLGAGRTMRLDRPNLRALLALAAYRLSAHNASPPVLAGN